jgi:hypothetical protein
MNLRMKSLEIRSWSIIRLPFAWTARRSIPAFGIFQTASKKIRAESGRAERGEVTREASTWAWRIHDFLARPTLWSPVMAPLLAGGRWRAGHLTEKIHRRREPGDGENLGLRGCYFTTLRRAKNLVAPPVGMVTVTVSRSALGESSVMATGAIPGEAPMA